MTETRKDSRRTASPGDARARILDTTYKLFSRHGVRAIGINRIIAESGVAKATLYHHFASKQKLVLAFLDLRQDRWTCNWLQTEMERRGATPREQLLAIVDIFDEWFQTAEYEGCSFARVVLEFPQAGDPIHQAAVRHLDVIRETLEELLVRAEVAQPDQVAHQLQTLMLGAILMASRGDLNAARRLRPLFEHLLDARASPDSELAQIGRVGYLAASRVLPGPTLRLSGELDFGCAEAVAEVLDAHYDGTPLRLDLADLGYVDVAGLRALRGEKGRRLTITSASPPVRKLVELLGWDTDPGIDIAEAA